MKADDGTTFFPGRKISEVFLEFAQPLIDLTVPYTRKDVVESILKIAFITWNAAVVEAVNGNDCFVKSIRETYTNDPITAGLMEMLLSRKRSEYADDERLIGEYSILMKNGEWILRAEARDPRVKSQ